MTNLIINSRKKTEDILLLNLAIKKINTINSFEFCIITFDK